MLELGFGFGLGHVLYVGDTSTTPTNIGGAFEGIADTAKCVGKSRQHFYDMAAILLGASATLPTLSEVSATCSSIVCDTG